MRRTEYEATKQERLDHANWLTDDAEDASKDKAKAELAAAAWRDLVQWATWLKDPEFAAACLRQANKWESEAKSR